MNNVFRLKERHDTHTHTHAHTGVWAHGVFHSQLGTPAVIIIISFVRARLCVKEWNMVGNAFVVCECLTRISWWMHTNACIYTVQTVTHAHIHTRTSMHVDDSRSLILPDAPVSDLGLQTIIKWKTNLFVIDSLLSLPICSSLLFQSALVHLEALHVSLLLLCHFFQSLYLHLQCVISLLKMSDKAREIQRRSWAEKYT